MAKGKPSALVRVNGIKAMMSLDQFKPGDEAARVYVGGGTVELMGYKRKLSARLINTATGRYLVKGTSMEENDPSWSEVWAAIISPTVIILGKCFRDDIEALDIAGYTRADEIEISL